jgi:hypothetical protein
MEALNRGHMAALFPAVMVVQAAALVLRLGQMAPEVLQALLDKVMLVAAESIPHLVMAEVEVAVRELLV